MNGFTFVKLRMVRQQTLKITGWFVADERHKTLFPDEVDEYGLIEFTFEYKLPLDDQTVEEICKSLLPEHEYKFEVFDQHGRTDHIYGNLPSFMEIIEESFLTKEKHASLMESVIDDLLDELEGLIE